jgi:antitoxin (DNA-binding transcriptional repressor) of toxin-antitoxin stability system
MKRVDLSAVTGSLSDYAREGLKEPVLITRQGRPVLAVMPLTDLDDRESVVLSTNAKFMEIVERSRAAGRTQGTRSLAEVRARVAPIRKRSPRRKG